MSELVMKTALDSPALKEKSEHYPAIFAGRVPKRVRVVDAPLLQGPAVLPAAFGGLDSMPWGQHFDAYVNSHGAVSAITGEGKMLGLMPHEFEVTEWHNWPVLISDEWLRESGFKWHQFDRQPGKQWLLWLDMACVEATGPKSFGEDLGLELTRGDTPTDERGPWYFCWLRADTSRRYSRFLHVRHLRWQHELIAMVEGLTGAKWAPADCFGGAMFSPESAARRRAEADRLDRRIMRESPPWREIEQDDSRGGALPEHMEAAVKRGGAK